MKLPALRAVLIAVAVACFHVAFLAECDDIHRCTVHYRGYFTSENKGVNPHSFRAVYPFGFVRRIYQSQVVFICSFHIGQIFVPAGIL